MAPAFDAASQLIDQTGTSGSHSHTCAGTDRLLLELIAWRSTTVTVSTVAFNATESLTRLGGSDNAGIRTDIWYRIAPTATTANIDVTLSAAPSSWDAFGVSYTAVDQSTPLDTIQTATGSGSSQSLTVTSAAGDLTISIVGVRLGGDITPNASQTQRGESTAGSITSCVSEEAGAASVAHDYTSVNADTWSMSGVNINAVAAAVVLPYQPWMLRAPVLAQ